MVCRYCGFKNDNQSAKFCEQCGKPLRYVVNYNHQKPYEPVCPQQAQKKFKKKGLSSGTIVAVILSCIALLLIGSIGITTIAKQNKIQTELDNLLAAKSNAEQYWLDYCEKNYSEVTKVSITHLHDNVDYYAGKNILTVAKIDDLNEDSFNTNVQNESFLFDGATFQFKQYNNELSYYQKDETVIVVGFVDGDSNAWSDVCVKDCHIIGSGKSAASKAVELNSLDYSYETTVPTASSGNYVWADEYTDISDFEYYIEDNDIYVGRYKGKSDKIRINSTYTIDGKQLNVVSLYDATFFCDDITSVIIPEGTKTIASNTFNSCGVKFVYLPSTLNEPESSFWHYFHDTEKIYYGGTEDDWKNICKVERSEIESKQIIFNANADDLK